MNTETGALYYGEDAILSAINRGEPIVRVSDQVAELIEAGRRARQPIRSSLPTLSVNPSTETDARLSAVEAKLAALERRAAAEGSDLIALPSPDEVRRFAVGEEPGHNRL